MVTCQEQGPWTSPVRLQGFPHCAAADLSPVVWWISWDCKSFMSWGHMWTFGPNGHTNWCESTRENSSFLSQCPEAKSFKSSIPADLALVWGGLMFAHVQAIKQSVPHSFRNSNHKNHKTEMKRCVCVSMCQCVCVSEWERERERAAL